MKEQTLKLTLLHCGGTVRSSHRWCSIKKAVHKNFAIFTLEHLCWGLFFNKVASLQACNFFKKRLQQRYFLWILRNFEDYLC